MNSQALQALRAGVRRQVADIVSIATAAQPLPDQYVARPVSGAYAHNALVSLGYLDQALKIELCGLDKARARRP